MLSSRNFVNFQIVWQFMELSGKSLHAVGQEFSHRYFRGETFLELVSCDNKIQAIGV
jgi:hypothetical protein